MAEKNSEAAANARHSYPSVKVNIKSYKKLNNRNQVTETRKTSLKANDRQVIVSRRGKSDMTLLTCALYGDVTAKPDSRKIIIRKLRGTLPSDGETHAGNPSLLSI